MTLKTKTPPRKEFQIHCEFSEMRDVVNLQPHPDNKNKHPDKQIALLAKILRFQGWRSPIQVSRRSGFVVAGHGRLEAAKLGGLQEVPIDIQDFETEADELAHLLADNRLSELSEIDMEGVKELLQDDRIPDNFDVDLTGYDEIALGDFDIETPSDADAEPKIDEASVLSEKWNTQKGQKWQCGNHFVFCGDSTSALDVEKLMAGNKAKVVMTSPPYGQQREYGEASELVKDWDKLMIGVFNVLPTTDDAQLIVNLGLIHKDGEWIDYWSKWIKSMSADGWLKIGWYVWDQCGGFPGKSQGRLGMSHEFVFHFGRTLIPAMKCEEKTTELKARSKSNTMGRDKSGKKKKISTPDASLQPNKIPDSVARIPRGNIDNVDHPAVYPVKLPRYFIRAWGGAVYDPFLGSGSTMMAAEQCGRVCYGMEIDPGYVAVILQRYQDATGKEPELMK